MACKSHGCWVAGHALPRGSIYAGRGDAYVCHCERMRRSNLAVAVAQPNRGNKLLRLLNARLNAVASPPTNARARPHVQLNERIA